jgi:hypothetical protein
LKELAVRCLRRQAPGTHLVEEGPQVLAVHRAKWLECIDFGSSWTIT